MRQSQLVNWYLKELSEEIESVDELAERKLLVEKVIERLVQHVSQSVNDNVCICVTVCVCTGSYSVATGDGRGK